MAVAAATRETEPGLAGEPIRSPWAQAVPEMSIDKETRLRAAEFIGRTATGSQFELVQYAGETLSLMDAIYKAREGDPAARHMVEMNVRTDVIERTIKAGHVMKVNLGVNADGQVMQYGQTAEAIQANSLRFASRNWQMRERTEAETRNMFRIQALYNRGMLQDYAFVVVSLAADNMSQKEMADEGFFVDTMSTAIQVTTVEAGSLTTESAFVAGKASRDAERHDAVAVGRLGNKLGTNFAGKSAAGIIDTPLLIHKKYLPDGAVNIVQWLDDETGGFFGQDKPRQDYREFLRQCRQREADLEPTVQDITNALLAADDIQSPRDATRRLSKLSEKHMLQRALTDEEIDGTVFGVESAYYLEAARYYLEQGDAKQAERFMDKAEAKAVSGSCPGGSTTGEDVEGGPGSNQSAEDDGDCSFTSKKCPLCGQRYVYTTVRRLEGGKKQISGSCHHSTIV